MLNAAAAAAVVPDDPSVVRAAATLSVPYKRRHDTARYLPTKRYLERRILADSEYSLETVPADELISRLRNYRLVRTGRPLSVATVAYLIYCARLFNPPLRLTLSEYTVKIWDEHARFARHPSDREPSSLASDDDEKTGGGAAAAGLSDNNPSQAHRITQQVEILSRRLIVAYGRHLDSVATTPFYTTHDVIRFSVAYAVLLCVMTNLRSSELLQLTPAMYGRLRAKEPVPIRIKKRTKSCRIICNDTLLERYHFAFDRLARHASRKRTTAEGGGGDGGLVVHDQVRVLSLSKSTLNRHISADFRALAVATLTPEAVRELYQQQPELATYVGGIQLIRKINTTNLIASSALTLAQVMNRHRDKRTTLNYYDTNNYTAAQLNLFYGRRRRQM